VAAESDDPELAERLAELGWRGPGFPTPPITRVAAYGLAWRGERVLLCRVAPGHLGSGSWTLPGGGLRFGESPEAAVVRELEEETGLRGRIAGSPEISSETGTWPLRGASVRFHQVRLVYPMEIVGGSQRDEAAGSTDTCDWFSAGDAARLKLTGLARTSLEPPGAAPDRDSEGGRHATDP